MSASIYFLNGPNLNRLERFPRKRDRFRDKKSLQDQYFEHILVAKSDSDLAGYALGTREPDTCGTTTLAGMEGMCRDIGEDLDLHIDFRQSNVEDILVDRIQEAGDVAQGLIFSPAACTHTSIAIRDAILTAEIPTVENHLSNVFNRQAFRHHSYVSPVALGVICGFGATGYRLALEARSTVVRP